MKSFTNHPFYVYLRICLTTQQGIWTIFGHTVHLAMPNIKRQALNASMSRDAVGTHVHNTEAMAEDPHVWLLRNATGCRIATDSVEAQAASANGARITAYLPLGDVTHDAHPTKAPIERLRECEEVLRSLASYLGVGGYNAPYVEPSVFHEKIFRLSRELSTEK